MAITETAETPSDFSLPRHFYCAVGRPQFKMETLVDLLGIASRRRGLPMVVCCSSRDELDAVCSAVAGIPSISLHSVHSDLAESERVSAFEKFRGETIRWNNEGGGGGGDDGDGDEENKSHMIVVTDSCLPFVASGELPVSARVLINYKLPTKKETYQRRISSCLAADGIVINMVVGGEVVTMKSLEESINLVIAEMPINISEIL